MYEVEVDEESIDLVDLGDATEETKQISPFGVNPDCQFNYGLYSC